MDSPILIQKKINFLMLTASNFRKDASRFIEEAEFREKEAAQLNRELEKRRRDASLRTD